MKAIRVSTASALVAHVLAWSVGVLLVFWPVYSGVSVTPGLEGEATEESMRTSATLIEVNGFYVLLLLLVPILLTGSALSAILFAPKGQVIRRAMLWTIVVVLLGFCWLAIFSIGIFYLPAAFAVLVAAVGDLSARERDDESQRQ